MKNQKKQMKREIWTKPPEGVKPLFYDAIVSVLGLTNEQVRDMVGKHLKKKKRVGKEGVP